MPPYATPFSASIAPLQSKTGNTSDWVPCSQTSSPGKLSQRKLITGAEFCLSDWWRSTQRLPEWR